MDIAKAIEYFKQSRKEVLSAYNRTDNIGFKHQAEYENEAILALGKQIPQKPVYQRIDEYAYGTMTATCPECANIVVGIFKKDYCENCGQRINWEV